VIDSSELEPEIKMFFGIAALMPVAFLVVGVFHYFGLLEIINIGIVIFAIGVSVFAGSLYISKHVSMKTAKTVAIIGLSLLLVEGLWLMAFVQRVLK
jgi:uncharacterized membrane protein YgdD (TMEM256/DUF423 family)